ncbi:porin [Paraburkholderia sp. JHI2823]|uniref:porin n=1 Tax=Paraburkholderia sp. JHI2823 TaxID=3112960 RepID=UPI00318219E5
MTTRITKLRKLTLASRSSQIAVLSTALGLGHAAQAADSVTIYGIVDAGITHVSNEGGKSNTLLDTGIMQGNRLGFRGVESLGGGLQAIFQLENGFSLANGALGQGGLLFGRQAWVGLSSDKAGSIKLGRQYDFFVDTLEAYYTPTWSAGGYANNPLDNDRLSGQRVNNSVKYMSPSFGGAQMGAMYGFSNLAGNFNGPGRTYSFTANFTRGNFSTGAAYTEVSGTTLDISSLVGSSKPVLIGGRYLRDWGIGASYALKPLTLYGVYTQALYVANAGPNQMFRNYQTGFSWAIRPDIFAGPGYGLTTLGGNKYHQLNLTVDYFLSKRTDVYAQTVIQHATGEGATAAVISMAASSNQNQVLFRVGMRSKF